jgi:hypothetical protein
VKLTIVGNTLTAYLDGVVVAEVADLTLTQGGVGLVVDQTNAEFDDVVVTVP